MSGYHKVIAVDFDGCLCVNKRRKHVCIVKWNRASLSQIIMFSIPAL